MATFAIALLAACSSLLAAEKPNVVIIFADDLGYGDVGCYGAAKVKTPHIDRLAREGRRFTDAHSASAVCTPSRYALLTGRYPARRGNLWGPVFLKSPLVVDPERLTIADVAKEAGYATACIGKWHLGFGSEAPVDWNKPLRPGPLELGFDYYFGMPVVNSHPPFVYVENDRPVGWDESDPFVRWVERWVLSVEAREDGEAHDFHNRQSVPGFRSTSRRSGRRGRDRTRAR